MFRTLTGGLIMKWLLVAIGAAGFTALPYIPTIPLVITAAVVIHLFCLKIILTKPAH